MTAAVVDNTLLNNLAHNLISVNVLTALKSALRGRGCETYPADMR
jgi:hypothetical protein